MIEVANMIRMVLSTMDKISVAGHEDMDRFLGCYQYLEKSVRMLEELAEQSSVNPDGTGED